MAKINFSKLKEHPNFPNIKNILFVLLIGVYLYISLAGMIFSQNLTTTDVRSIKAFENIINKPSSDFADIVVQKTLNKDQNYLLNSLLPEYSSTQAKEEVQNLVKLVPNEKPISIKLIHFNNFSSFISNNEKTQNYQFKYEVNFKNTNAVIDLNILMKNNSYKIQELYYTPLEDSLTNLAKFRFDKMQLSHFIIILISIMLVIFSLFAAYNAYNFKDLKFKFLFIFACITGSIIHLDFYWNTGVINFMDLLNGAFTFEFFHIPVLSTKCIIGQAPVLELSFPIFAVLFLIAKRLNKLPIKKQAIVKD